jgi:hypothetical protein
MERIYSQRLSNRFGSGNLIPNITTSLGYQQAGIEGKQRMEGLFNMGLPLQSDINKTRLEGFSPYGTAIYSASPQQSYGGFGSIGGGERKPKATSTPQQEPTPQPTEGMADIAGGIAPTFESATSAYSGSALAGTSYTPSAGNMGMGMYGGPTTGLGKTSIAGGVAPSPLAAPIPKLNFPTRKDEILNPYGLMNL